MEKFIVTGGNRLSGQVLISGAKNAAVAIIPATVLADDVCRIENIPNISDVSLITRILFDLGAHVKMINHSTLEIDTRHILRPVSVCDLMRHIFNPTNHLKGARSPM